MQQAPAAALVSSMATQLPLAPQAGYRSRPDQRQDQQQFDRYLPQALQKQQSTLTVVSTYKVIHSTYDIAAVVSGSA